MCGYAHVWVCTRVTSYLYTGSHLLLNLIIEQRMKFSGSQDIGVPVTLSYQRDQGYLHRCVCGACMHGCMCVNIPGCVYVHVCVCTCVLMYNVTH